MIIALLSGANPNICKEGPKVRLSPGRWKLECDGIRDSSLSLTLTSIANIENIMNHHVHHDSEVDVNESSICQIAFRNRGSERFINVTLRKVA